MPSNQCKCRLAEETRLMKATRLAGLIIKRVTRDEQGRPVYITDQDEAADCEQKNPLDRILQNASHEDGAA
jgi:predicted RNA-binding protein YlxR (DUF448 family)